jgi:hypothetical protein
VIWRHHAPARRRPALRPSPRGHCRAVAAYEVTHYIAPAAMKLRCAAHAPMRCAAFCHVVGLLRSDPEHPRPQTTVVSRRRRSTIFHRTGEFTLDRDRYIFSYLAQRGASLGRSAMSDATGSGNTAPDPATADNPPQDIGAGDQARDPEGSAAHQSDQKDAGLSGDQMPTGDQGG